MALRDRMPMRLEMDKEDLPLLRANAADPNKDRTGVCTSSVQGTLRFIGIAEFVVAGDVGSFRRHLAEAAKLKLQLFERQAQGEPIDPSYLAMLAYKELFDALAACDMATAEALARHMGGRPDIEKEHDHPFDRCLGYTLKAFVLNLPDQMATWSADFTMMCRDPENADFMGYAMMFQGILQRDVGLAQEGLTAIAKGHKRLIKGGGMFNSTPDEVICVWGVGLANLARARGLSVTAVAPFIPAELLCG